MTDGEIWDDYERTLRGLLSRVRQRHLQSAIDRLLDAARRLMQRTACSAEAATTAVYSRTRERVIRRLLRRRQAVSQGARRQCEKLLEAHIPRAPSQVAPDFHCDAAMCGLSRWLRAAGYDAAYWPGVDDDELLQKVRSQPAIMLTTDHLLLERSVVRRGAVAARLVSNRLNKFEQFLDVVQRLSLPIRAPRCMACGGPLMPVPKEALKDRIPPRTYLWLNDYFVCRRCDQLFWQGTHWRRIQLVLDRAASPAKAAPNS